jgi:hypothetical protein
VQNPGIPPLLFGFPAMPIPITCPSCAKGHQAPDKLAGKSAKCGCGTVIQIPALAAAAPVLSARPKGAWQSPAAMPTTPTPAGPSVFDEISIADLNRGQRPAPLAAPIAEPILQPGSVVSPAGQVVGDVMSRVRNEMVERERNEAEKLPYSVSLAMAGLGVPGGMHLFGGFAALLALGTEFIEEVGGPVIIMMFVLNFLFAAIVIPGSVLLYFRVPFSRPYAYFAGLVTLLSGFCNPVNFFCAILTLWFLAMPETTEYLAKKGKPGVIEW